MTTMPVFLTDEQDLAVDGDDLLALARYVLAAREVPPEMEVTVLLVDEPTMTELNSTHMGASGPTDVLAFPIDDPNEIAGEQQAILGDVVLCPAVAFEQARGLGRDGQQELRLLTTHGILHLLGMDHAEPAEEREMFSLTDELLAGYDAGAAP
jgi:probable rRNA maturation factor